MENINKMKYLDAFYIADNHNPLSHVLKQSQVLWTAIYKKND